MAKPRTPLVKSARTSGTHPTLVSLFIMVDATSIEALTGGSDPGSRYLVYLHELGHVAGLGHNASADSLMARSFWVGGYAFVTEQGRADLRASTRSCREPSP
jgi:hypothetical protein